MKLKTAIIVSALCFAHPVYGLLYGSSAALPTKSSDASQNTSPASAKQYRLGEAIQVREGITLKIVPGSSKSVELFKSKLRVTDASIVLDVEFEMKPSAGGGIFAFELGESVGKSGVFLNAGEEKITPKGVGLFPNSEGAARGRVPSAVRVEDGLHIMGATSTGRQPVSFLFELNADQLKLKKKLTLNIMISPPEERYSFVIDLDSKGPTD